jgi:benzil reductase ((S)-benzoin forming)
MNAPRQIMITGISSGIGAALAKACLERGDQVMGFSRRDLPWAPAEALSNALRFTQQDISNLETLPQTLTHLTTGVEKIHLLVLNAGVLGEMRDIGKTSMEEIQRIMTINTWSNKILLDHLFDRGIVIDQVIGMSSGAAVSGSRGWNAYALSKAALNMLLQLYAAERPDTHFCSFAPGLVDTAMQDYLCGLPASDCETYPTLARIQQTRGTDIMPSPEALAEKLLHYFERVRSKPSGSFIDIRDLSD